MKAPDHVETPEGARPGRPASGDTPFARWMTDMGYRTDKEASAALGVTSDTIKNLRTGSTRGRNARPAEPDRRTLLAMAALTKGLMPWAE